MNLMQLCFKQITGTKKIFFYLACLYLSLFFVQKTVAEPAKYHFGVGIINFDYAEYDTDNRFLDGETGLIPGLIIKRKQYHQQLFNDMVLQLHGNIIEYDGETQDGVPAQTDSSAIIFDGHYKLGGRFFGNQEFYLGMGYRYWYRHIHNGYDNTGRPIAGLLEHYKWFYWLAGYAADYRVSETVSVGYDFRFTKMFSATMDIDHLGFRNYDDKTVNLGNRAGAKISVPVRIKTTKNNYIIAPYFEYIDIGRSNSVIATQNGGIPVPGTDCGGLPTDRCLLTEPRSETRNVGIEFTWLW